MLDMVKDFHKAFEHPLKETIFSDEPLKTRQLRIKLLFEELTELAEASDCMKTMDDLCVQYKYKISHTPFQNGMVTDGYKVNHIEELDALCDIMYVLCGKILTGGYHKVFDSAFRIVHTND